ncbi:hypothetical protein [Paenibacillus alkalitolerans]|uniref:hypothetical protein n=1 Tax=Paenibacillus alkalitolerans TaxID=2799335 RepID=UPI002D7E361F|nr:hypothetical protein [Paenibacillus alkalitolerans]
MKKWKKPGENISLKTKKNESAAVMEWLNSQTNLMDSIRYLIENEIRMNGVRNLQLTIPAERPSFVSSPLPPFNNEVASALEQPRVFAGHQPNVADAVRRDDEIDDADIESWM